MTSDLSRTGPVERDIEQVSTISQSSMLASCFNFSSVLVVFSLLGYCLLLDFVYLCNAQCLWRCYLLLL